MQFLWSPHSSPNSINLGSTVSRQLLKRTRTARSPELAFKIRSIKVSNNTLSVLWWGLKPTFHILYMCWHTQNISCSCIKTSSSNILDKTVNLKMFLKLHSTKGSSLVCFLLKGCTAACFKGPGTEPELWLEFISAWIGFPIVKNTYFKRWEKILPMTQLLGLRFPTTSDTQDTEMSINWP